MEPWYAHIPIGFAWILSYFDFSFISKCIIYVLYLFCCLLSAYLSEGHALWNIIYRGSVYCVPKRNDRPLAKDLSESRLFTLETVTEWKYPGQSKFITVAQLRERYFISSAEIISKPVFHCISAICTPFEYRYRMHSVAAWWYCSTFL